MYTKEPVTIRGDPAMAGHRKWSKQMPQIAVVLYAKIFKAKIILCLSNL